MRPNTDVVNDLRSHLALCEEVLALTQTENQTLRDAAQGSQFETYQARKVILPRLEQSLAGIREHRRRWQESPAGERAQTPEVSALLRQNQDLIMKIIVLDRENEQTLLRRGMVPPRHIPPAPRQKPHFVADLYRRSG